MLKSIRSAISVLIVDDHPVVLSGCRSLFASDSNVKIDVATDAKSGHRAYVSRKPDVTVIDIKLPDVSGFELMRRIRKEDPDAKIIMFSMNDDPAFVVRAIELGAQGYSESDFIAAETVLWPDQPEAYWLTVIADSLGSGRGFRFVRTHQQ